jgi:hypothetical protein
MTSDRKYPPFSFWPIVVAFALWAAIFIVTVIL